MHVVRGFYSIVDSVFDLCVTFYVYVSLPQRA